MSSVELAERLSARLAQVLGHEVTIGGLHQLTGGASRETWAFEAASADGRRRLVLRRDPPAAPPADGMAREASAIAAADRAGVAVPPLVDFSVDPAILGSAYLITGHVDGETIPHRLLRDPRYAPVRAGMARELGRTLARIHSIPVEEVPAAAATDPLGQLWASYDALGEPMPVVELALSWLETHPIERASEAIVHGDFRNGNLIIDERGLRAVLDWEFVHRGDPHEDLGWLTVRCWRFGSPLEAGGFGTMEQLLQGYSEVAGVVPSLAAIRWWQIHRTIWWALACREMAERHLSGQQRSVELAAIGRRLCEQEHDLLLALHGPLKQAGSPETPGELPQWSDLHGRPTASELLRAVAGFLREEVLPATDARVSFLARVGANVLDMVDRELRLGPSQWRAQQERLRSLGVRDQAALAHGIRDGTLDADDPALLAALRGIVIDRLRVANPKYLLDGPERLE